MNYAILFLLIASPALVGCAASPAIVPTIFTVAKAKALNGLIRTPVYRTCTRKHALVSVSDPLCGAELVTLATGERKPVLRGTRLSPKGRFYDAVHIDMEHEALYIRGIDDPEEKGCCSVSIEIPKNARENRRVLLPYGQRGHRWECRPLMHNIAVVWSSDESAVVVADYPAKELSIYSVNTWEYRGFENTGLGHDVKALAYDPVHSIVVASDGFNIYRLVLPKENKHHVFEGFPPLSAVVRLCFSGANPLLQFSDDGRYLLYTVDVTQVCNPKNGEADVTPLSSVPPIDAPTEINRLGYLYDTSNFSCIKMFKAKQIQFGDSTDYIMTYALDKDDPKLALITCWTCKDGKALQETKMPYSPDTVLHGGGVANGPSSVSGIDNSDEKLCCSVNARELLAVQRSTGQKSHSLECRPLLHNRAIACSSDESAVVVADHPAKELAIYSTKTWEYRSFENTGLGHDVKALAYDPVHSIVVASDGSKIYRLVLPQGNKHHVFKGIPPLSAIRTCLPGANPLLQFNDDGRYLLYTVDVKKVCNSENGETEETNRFGYLYDTSNFSCIKMFKAKQIQFGDSTDYIMTYALDKDDPKLALITRWTCKDGKAFQVTKMPYNAGNVLHGGGVTINGTSSVSSMVVELTTALPVSSKVQ